MTFTDAIRKCLQKYVSIEGRARRSEYWWFLLFAILGGFVLGAVDAVIFGDGVAILAPIFNLALFLPLICVAIRRLHDRDMSGWWILLALVPLIGSLILLVIYALPGTDGPNRFGPDPVRGGSGPDDGESEGDYAPSSIPRSGHS